MPMLRYQDLLEIGLSEDKTILQGRLVAAAEKLGFGLSGGTFIRGRLSSGKAQVIAFGNTPEAFLQASRSLDVGLRDPLLTAMVGSQGCYTYDQDFYARAGAGDLWDNQAAFGYRQGMAIALHEFSHMEMFSFGVDGPDALPSSPTARTELEGSLRLVALHAHEAAKRLYTPAPIIDPGQFTEPEREALRWAADAEVISRRGDMLVVTNPGRSAARKLGANTGTQAVLRAIDGGLIDR